MFLRNRIKIVKRALARYGLWTAYFLVGHLPYGFVKGLMRVLGAIGFQFMLRLRRIARETLQIAFEGEKDAGEINEIIKKCFSDWGQSIFELIYFSQHPQEVVEFYTFEGREHVDEALKQGRGVIAVTAHFGNFPLMQLAFARFGYKVNVLIRKARDEKIAAHAYKTMKSVGVNPIYTMPVKQCVQESLRALRRNEIVFILLDQNFGSGGGVYVDFFGRKAATGTGPIIFTERTQSPILLMFNKRMDGSRHKIIIEPPFTLSPHEDHDEMLRLNVQIITTTIERYIRKNPHEWGWMHQRWKSQPPPEAEKTAEAPSAARA